MWIIPGATSEINRLQCRNRLSQEWDRGPLCQMLGIYLSRQKFTL